MRRWTTLVLFTFLLCTFAWSTPPELINLQGRLTNASGNAINTGSQGMRFEIYDDATGGTLLLSDEHSGGSSVVVTDGHYNVMLGNGSLTGGAESSLADVFSNHTNVYVEIHVHNGTAYETLAPRIRLVSVGFALQSAHSQDSALLNGLPGSTYRQDFADVLTQGNSAGNVRLTDLMDPSAPSDAATMNYVDTTNGSQDTLISSNTSSIAANTSSISGLGSSISTNTTNIASNTGNITTLSSSFTAHAADSEAHHVLNLASSAPDVTATALELNQALSGIGVNVTSGNLDSLTDGSSADTLHSHTLSAAGGWSHSGTDVVLSVSTDNVGIGTSSPSQRLHVVDNDSGSQGLLAVLSNEATATNSLSSLSLGADNGAVATLLQSDGLGTGALGTPGGYIGTATNHPLGIFTNNIERIQISASGTVSIANTLNIDGGFGISGTTVTSSAADLNLLSGRSGATLWGDDNDGSGSGLDADTIDGFDSGTFATSGHGHSLGGDLTGTEASANVVKIQGQSVAGTSPSVNQVLKWNGTAWEAAADDTGTGTIPSAGTAGQLLIDDGANWVSLAPGGAAQVLHGGASPSWGALDLTADVTGALPLANGGTGQSSYATGGIPFSDGTILAEDPTNFFWDDTNNRLGVGTNAPSTALQVSGTVTATAFAGDGSSLTGIVASDSDTLDALDSTDFLRTSASSNVATGNTLTIDPGATLDVSGSLQIGGTGVTSTANDLNTVAGRSGATLWGDDNDGSGSTLDADTVDGLDSSAFVLSGGNSNVTTGNTMTIDSGATLDIAGNLQIAGTGVSSTAGDLNTVAGRSGATLWGDDNHGSGSTLDADLLDGLDSGVFLRNDQNGTLSGDLTLSNLTTTGTTTLNTVAYSWPGADGTSGQVLTSDGAGSLSWTTPSAGDADTLDTLDSADFLRTSASSNVATGNTLTTDSGSTLNVAGTFEIAGVGVSSSAADLNLLSGRNAATIWGDDNHGASSGLDADLLDGISSAAFLRSDAADTHSGGTLTLAGGVDVTGTFALSGVPVTASATELNLLAGKSGTVWTSANHGTGSTLDADLLDGNHASAFATSGHSHTFTGDVTGTVAATNVVKIQGSAISATAPSANEVLKWNGSAWAPAADDTGVGTIPSPGTAGQILYDNGGAWVALAPGNASELLTSDGAGGVSWASAGGGLLTDGGATTYINATTDNFGIGTTTASQRLVVGANSTGAEEINVLSQHDAALGLFADSDNDGSEIGAPFVWFSQDNAATTSIVGLVQTAGNDSAGNAYTGSLADATLFGNHTATAVQLGTNSNARLTVDANGNVGIGTNAPSSALEVNGNASLGTGSLLFGTPGSEDTSIYRQAADVLRTSDTLTIRNDVQAVLNLTTYVSSTTPSTVQFMKARGTEGGQLVVAGGDVLANMNFLGFDGSTMANAGWIRAYVDGTPGSGDMPGRIELATTPDGASLGIPRLSIMNDGEIRFMGSTSGFVGFIPQAAAGSTTYVLPAADGGSGQVLSTDGAGNLSWSSPSAAGGWTDSGTTVHTTTSTDNVGIGNASALAALHVGTGGTPGIAGANDAYFQNDAEVDGSVDIGNTLTVTSSTVLNGGLTMDGGLFSVADATGNTSTNGTLTAQGATTLNGGLSMDGGVFTVADGTGAVHTNSNLNVNGVTTLTGNVDLGDTVADAINFHGVAASTLDMNANVITNIGVAATDFTGTGGLNLADDLDVANTLFADVGSLSVGIGTSSPVSRFHVYNSTPVTSAAITSTTISANTTGTAAVGFGPSLMFQAEDSLGNVENATRISSIMTNVTNGTEESALVFEARTAGAAVVEKMRIAGDGNVGIGSNAPTSKLDVNGTVTATAFAGSIAPGLTAGSVVFDNGSGLAEDNTNLFWDDTNDRLGIGTNSPVTTFDITTGATTNSAVHIGETVNEGGYIASFNDSELRLAGGADYVSGTTVARSTSASLVLMNGGNVAFYGDSGLTDGSGYTATERMRIANDGNVGIGTNGPEDLLHVFDTAGTGDNPLVLLSDGDVTHGFSDLASGHVFGRLGTTSQTDGGLQIRGFSDSASTGGLFLAGSIGNASPASNVSAVTIAGAKLSGTGLGGLDPTDRALSINNAGSTKFTVLGNGNVGIGLGAGLPASELDVNGTVSATSFAGDGSGLSGISGQGKILFASIAAGSTTTTIPDDDTVPLSGEGAQIASQAITLASATSDVRVSFDLTVAGVSGDIVTVVIFRGATAIQSKQIKIAANDEPIPVAMTAFDTPGTVGPHTYTVRIGGDTGNTLLYNQRSGGNDLGGTMGTYLEVREIE